MMADIRERVVRLEVQLAEVTKRVNALNDYLRQPYQHMNNPR
jgi:uncharacterized coiled-coil protein SlyX